ncbi:alpha-(1,3)-fucosyltransferase C-like [Ceratina calcarata]|uniref:Fucosyltransferase n=1 Tax=Ceratina calcarata TaxID=156304 RepID=A0AAJ7WC67_9HYME|nr:alpha-(1,3)-fucosyltransferase C-like [Ceratina calcarata]XP_026670075.1 alpha-(1,3)-fucosyltransferase C-like [Ceratina calcarata]XP_026670076.1 alpha-(1,3)-fucosyltransferase C-like [Ceratina calcarata]
MKLWIVDKTRLFMVLSMFTFTLYILSFYFNFTIYDLLRFKRITVEYSRLTNTTKKILFWNTMFGDKTFYMGDGDVFLECPVNNCYATYDRDYVDLVEFDAVLFHANELEISDLPERRSPWQWYVFVNLESPTNRPLINNFYEDYFNLTMTYRLDSDITWNYGIVRDANNERIVAPSKNPVWNAFNNQLGEHEKVEESKNIRRKTKPIVWFVSNCMAESGREKYVNELAKYMQVDVYGKCGRMSCPFSKDCFAEVTEPNYFFYLSFENSLCNDYVTEKLYNALRYDVVPIVYSGANYSLFAPPRSYINVLDFDSPRDLAKYLKKLIENPKEYNEFFAWKRYYKIDSGTQQAACDLCKLLHERKEPQMYNRMTEWYSESKCPLQKFLNYQGYITGSIIKRKD